MTWERLDVEAPNLATSERAEANGRHIALPGAAERGLGSASRVTERGDRPPYTGLARRVTAKWRLFAVRVLNYLTNHIVSHVPSFALRRAWYRHILGIQFGPHSGIYLGCYIWFYGRGQIRHYGVRIGASSRVNRNCTLDVRGGLQVGDNVSISPDVAILTIANLETSRSHGEGKPVVIEDNVWIGTRAMIMPGVTLGRGSVVAAGAVVMRDVPPQAVVFGVPARPVGTRTEEEADYVLGTTFPLFE
jgi:maltose O-acetyltransferase